MPSTGPGIDNKFSNIIGTRLPEWVIKQLDIRSNQNTQDSRSNDNLIYLANKTSWVRLVSSVELGSENDLKYFNDVGEKDSGLGLGRNYIENSSSLSKKFILYGGTAKYLRHNSYGLRSGIDKDGAYGMLGNKEIQEFGYRPMPGITGVHIETQGRLGSLRVATVSFKCWDKYQLDIIDTLYFKLGYSMFLEFGNTNYFKSPYFDLNNVDKVFSSELNTIDPFQEPTLTKEQILAKISQNVRDSEGNYGAVFGIVTNFNFSYNQEGGYDCTIKITGLGYLGESIKVNNPGVLPNILKEEITLLDNTLSIINNQNTGSTDSGNASDQFIQDAKPNDLLQILALNWLYAYKGKGNSLLGPAKYWRSYQELAEKDPNTFSTIAFINSNELSNITRVDFRDLLKSINSINDNKIIYPPSDFGYSISLKDTELNGQKKQALNFYGVPNEAFYRADYYLQKDNTYVLGVNSTRPNIILSDKFSYSNIQLNLDYLKSRYLTNLKDKSYAGNDMLNLASANFAKKPELVKQFPSINVTTSDLMLDSNTAPVGLDYYYKFGISYRSNVLSNADSFDPYFFNIAIERSFKDQNGANRGIMDNQQILSTLNQVMSKDGLEGGVFYNTTENGSLSFKELNISKGVGSANKFLSPTIIKNINPNYSHYFFSIVYYVKLDKVGYNLTVTNTTTSEITNVKTTNKETTRQDVYAKVVISFNDSSLIKDIVPDNQGTVLRDPDLDKKKLEEQNQKEKQDLEDQKRAQEERDAQIAEAIKYQSALEILLRTIQLHSLNKAINNTGKPDIEIGKAVFKCLLTKDSAFIDSAFSNGIFSSCIKELISGSVDTKKYDPISNNKSDLLKMQAKYGFASSLMANLARPDQLKPVDYEELLTTYVVPYQWDKEIMKGVNTNHPVYISFGGLLMILNHMCTIYDTNKSSEQTPLVYIDFNPNHNFCLSNNQQLSTNPWITLIPCEASFDDYKKLFDPTIISGDNILPISGSSKPVPLFNPEKDDVLSGDILKFRDGNSYRGKIMNILLNIDYLVDIVHSYASKSEDNNVYLKEFIEHILSDVCKYTGNFNIFRLSYTDAGNTFQIVDDQVVPTPEGEIMVEPNIQNESNRTEIPLFGKKSIAKSLEIKSEVSTKLGNMLAISANSDYKTQATLSKNGDNFGFLNSRYYDRYIVNRLEAGAGVIKPDYDTAKISAQQFNESISDFYSRINPSEANVSHVTSYYIDRMTKVKSDAFPTRASAMIPVSVNFSTDGFYGFQIGQAFTISDMLLPYVYTSKKVEGAPDYDKKVGFVIVGLDHNFDSNMWTTNVRANMTYLKDKTAFKGEPNIKRTNLKVFGINERNQVNEGTGIQDTNFVASSTDLSKNARAEVQKYLGSTTISDRDWNMLVAGIYAEASNKNAEEQVYITSVILNRAINSKVSVSSILKAPNQFQSVTGTSDNNHSASPMFVSGPSQKIESDIYNSIITYLPKIKERYANFTSANKAAYYFSDGTPRPGINTDFYTNAINKKWKKVGGTLFGNA